jgi:hypothetical protein
MSRQLKRARTEVYDVDKACAGADAEQFPGEMKSRGFLE